MDKKNVLYISYDGMTDTLGQSRVLSYLIPLSKKGVIIHIISFEKPELYLSKKEIVIDRLKGTEITWHPLLYTKKPPVVSTLKDIMAGWRLIKKLQKDVKFDIVHCRGYISAIIGERMKRKLKTKFLFDMRGWWVDEKLESGNWNSIVYKPIYNYFKNKESDFFKNADYVVSLTYKGKDEILKRRLKNSEDIGVIPTCVDFNIFPPFDERIRLDIRKQLNIPQHAALLVYSGSVGGNYKLSDFVTVYKSFINFFTRGYFLILSKVDADQLKNELKELDVDLSRILILSSDFNKVNQYLMAADIGLILYDLNFSIMEEVLLN